MTLDHQSTCTHQLSAVALKRMLSDGKEIALLDVREHGQYGEGHPFFSTPCPYSVIEEKAPALIPNLQTRIVLIDHDDGVAELANLRLEALGYTNVSCLQGGVQAWAAAGFELFKGVNVPCKAFGELIEHDMDTPSISAEELHQRFAEKEPLVVYDGRTPDEFEKMNIPGAVSLPNAELGLRLPTYLKDPSTPIIINCAGRTRSIIGAQTLLSLGFPNPIVALRNGTQGWQLAGFELNHGAVADPMPDLSEQDIEQAKIRYNMFVKTNELPVIDMGTFAKWHQDEARTVYLFDPRTREEYAAGHIAGSLHAPGGQMVQAVDQWVGVRNARIVLHDPMGLRAATTCFWLRKMGHDAYIMETPHEVELEVDEDSAISQDTSYSIDAAELLIALDDGAQLLDLTSSIEFRAAHIEQARWAVRPRLKKLKIDPKKPVILTSANPVLARLAVIDLIEMGIEAPLLLRHDIEGWRAAGLNIVATEFEPSDEDMIDFLFFVHDRHSGSLESARRYLEWETGLIAQMDEDELSVFRTSATPQFVK